MTRRAPLHSFLSSRAAFFSVVLAWSVVFLSGSLSATPQVVLLNSGERLVGEVLPRSNAEFLILKSTLLGELSLPRAQIVKIEPKMMPPVAVASAKAQTVSPGVQSKSAEKQEKQEAKKAKKVVDQAQQKVDTQVAIAEKMAEVQGILEEEQPLVQKLMGLRAPESWKGNVRMGMNISSGDSQWTETALRGNLEIKPKGRPDFYRITGSYTYRETERNNGDRYKSTDRYDAAFIYRRSFSDDNWFLQNSVSGRVDQIKGIDHEVQELVGGGYKYTTPSKQFELVLGGSGGLEDYKTDSDDSRNGVNQVLNVFQEFTWKPFTRTSFVQKFNYYWEPDYVARYNYVVTAAVRIRLTDLLGFEFSYNQNYDNDIGNGNQKNDAVWRNALIVYF
ncbi:MULTISPECIES: DUF481 domain-containing protein [unclassified Lentimonas]|uniref:DUF481 domain-containing protein n=1 Tax=unclassified Lentimonas TaxID=2630993 RepID=UPI00132C2972|nr:MULTISPECIES: DUF481 domain-containing protein [unclassified Lentimonas]CAA6676578.1 Unannotated [Lentimonas sp. CC4]CAA6684758.1 Unannotated [Lentimonas sp. CC6]CAA7075394.1 Unannotated [Lentimonas sp. CC4]CAA7168943.1 Unannotated [Lentimonas sp. CC21]CAA7182197.1 Unannotated [Lentimonas sp. CC8]